MTKAKVVQRKEKKANVMAPVKISFKFPTKGSREAAVKSGAMREIQTYFHVSLGKTANPSLSKKNPPAVKRTSLPLIKKTISVSPQKNQVPCFFD